MLDHPGSVSYTKGMLYTVRVFGDGLGQFPDVFVDAHSEQAARDAAFDLVQDSARVSADTVLRALVEPWY